MSEEVAIEPQERSTVGISIRTGTETTESVDMEVTGSPEPEPNGAESSDRSEISKVNLGFEKVNKGPTENDSDFPNDPHQLQVNTETSTTGELKAENIVDEGKLRVNGVSAAEPVEGEFKFEYSSSGYHYYTSIKTGSWFAQDDAGYWYTQDVDGTFKAYTPVATDETLPPAPEGLPPPESFQVNQLIGSTVIESTAEPEPPKLDNGLPPSSIGPKGVEVSEYVGGQLPASDDRPIVVEPISAADIHQTAASVVASLSDGSAVVEMTDDMLAAPSSPLMPFDSDGRPIYPKRADGKPILPLTREGKAVFQMDAEGYPMYPVDDFGEPVNDTGEPVFGLGPGCKPMVPMDSKDQPVYPLNTDGTPIFPYGPDGKPTVAYSLKTKNPVLPLDEAGRPILPASTGIAPVSMCSARADDLPAAVSLSDSRTPLLPLPSAVASASVSSTPTPTVVQSPASMYSLPPPSSAASTTTPNDWNQYWAQYYQQYYQAYGSYYYSGATPPTAGAFGAMMPRPFGLPPTNVPPPNMFGVSGFGMGVGPTAAALTPTAGFGAGFKKLKVRPEDIDLPAGPAPAPTATSSTSVTSTVVSSASPGTAVTTTTMLTSSLSTATKLLDDKMSKQEDVTAKKEATKSLISKQIKAFASMQKMKQEKENQTAASLTPTTAPSLIGRLDDGSNVALIKEEDVYGPKVAPPGVIGGSLSSPAATTPVTTASETVTTDLRLDKAALPALLDDAPKRNATPQPIRKISSPVARRKYRSRSTSSSASSHSVVSSTSATSRAGSRTSSPRRSRHRRRSSSKSDDSISRASSSASPRKRRRSRSRSHSSYSRSKSRSRSRSRSKSRSRSRSTSRSRSYSRSPRRSYGPRYGWRGRGSMHDDRWRGRWRGSWRGGPSQGRGGYYSGGWRGGRRGSVGWSPRRRSSSRSPQKWRKSRSGSASSRSTYSRSRSPEDGGAVAATSPSSPLPNVTSQSLDVERSPAAAQASSLDRQRRDLRSPVSSVSSVSSPRRYMNDDTTDKVPTATTTPRRDEQDMSISSQTPQSDIALQSPPRSARSKGGDTDRQSVRSNLAKQPSTADLKAGTTLYEPESPLLDSIIGDLTVKITNADDQQVDWPAKLILDTRTVPILRYSCNPEAYESFKILKKAFDEEQQLKATQTKRPDVAPVFQNRPITFGLSSKFETSLMLQKVTTPSAIEEPSAPKWKPFGFVEADTTLAPVPEPDISLEPIKKTFSERQLVSQTRSTSASAGQYLPTPVDAELENLRHAALLSMKKAQKDLAYYESVVQQIEMGLMPTKHFLRPSDESERKRFEVDDMAEGVEEGELLDDITNESEPQKISKKKLRKLAKKQRSQKKLSKKEKKRRKKKRARDTDDENDYLSESSDEDIGEPKRKRAKVSSDVKKRKQRKRDKKRRRHGGKKRSSSSKRRREKKRRHRRDKSRRHRRRRRRSSTSSDADDVASSSGRRELEASTDYDDDMIDGDSTKPHNKRYDGDDAEGDEHSEKSLVSS